MCNNRHPRALFTQYFIQKNPRDHPAVRCPTSNLTPFRKIYHGIEPGNGLDRLGGQHLVSCTASEVYPGQRTNFSHTQTDGQGT